jgi:L-lactate dehydrogenase complex protein LldF
MFKPTELDRAIEAGLGNRFLRTALAHATAAITGGRLATMAEIGGFAPLRERARQSRDRVLNHLNEYLERTEEAVQRAGGHVFWAETGQDVAAYLLELAREKGVKTVVKGKSMVTEEIELGPALERAGIEVFETDLGEYIIQLAGERPSHIVLPALHKSREEVARLFEEKLGLPYTDVPEDLTRAARQALRRRFLEADMGITGANFVVAETGTVVLIENEGNIRLTTTLPRIHVAITGIEKIVADFDDLVPLLRVLPVSALNLKMPGYASFLTGPAGPKGEGPEEFHLVLLDSYRSQVLADEDFRQMLRCIRCGACLNACPVYGHIGGHAYPWVYSGPMGMVLTALARGPAACQDLLMATTLCRACAEVCPVMIDQPAMFLKLRRLAAEGQGPLLTGAAAAAARWYASPLGYDLTTRALKAVSRILVDDGGRVRQGPEVIKKMGKRRRLPRLAETPFHRLGPEKEKA